MLVAAAAGQEKTPQAGPAPGNVFSRILRGSYEPPSVTGFEVHGDESLDALFKDGQLRLSAEDAIRLALQNNLDIMVNRYDPYFSLWGFSQARRFSIPTFCSPRT